MNLQKELETNIQKLYLECKNFKYSNRSAIHTSSLEDLNFSIKRTLLLLHIYSNTINS